MKTIAKAITLLLVLTRASLGETPNTVWLEELTWEECRDAIRAGKTTLLIPTGGTEQNGPHMVLGKHNFVLRYTMDQVAREWGNALVAPVLAYVPEGGTDPPTGHMRYAGTVSLPNEVFMELLEQAARSFRASGFKDVVMLGDSGGNQNGMKEVAERLAAEWRGSGFRIHYIPDYYTKAHADQNKILIESYGESPETIGRHAGILDTSELLAIDPRHIRRSKIAPGGGYEGSGVNGDPTRASAARGQLMLAIKINHALHQIRQSVGDGALSPNEAPPAQAAAGPTHLSPDTVWLEELTWEEVRDRIQGGANAVVIPTGGTEQNGPHMLLGKHNYVVRFAAEAIARRLGKALVAPVLQYVPEGDYNRPDFGKKPGVITCLPATFARVLEQAARSFKVHGFSDILLIGDSGGNQQPLRDAAAKLNQEWAESPVRVFPLTDYYYIGREHYRAFLLAQFGYDDEIVGSHAGISDTSQVLFVYPKGIRPSRLAPRGGGPDSGVSGDPTKATAEIGRMGLEFKVNAAIRQYQALKNPPAGRTSGER